MLSIAGLAHAEEECLLAPSTQGPPPTYQGVMDADGNLVNDPPLPQTLGNRQWRILEWSVMVPTPAASAEALVEAAGLEGLFVDPDGDGRAVLNFQTFSYFKEFLDGPCTGLVEGPLTFQYVYLIAFTFEDPKPRGPQVLLLAHLGDESGITGSDTGAEIEVEISQQRGKTLKMMSQVEGSDGSYRVQTHVEIPEDAEFVVDSTNYAALNVPVRWAYSPALSDVPIWIDVHRKRHDLDLANGDSAEIHAPDGRVCFEQLIENNVEGLGEDDLCVEIGAPMGGMVYKDGEYHSGRGVGL